MNKYIYSVYALLLLLNTYIIYITLELEGRDAVEDTAYYSGFLIIMLTALGYIVTEFIKIKGTQSKG